MTRLRSRQAETEDVVPRRLKRGAVKRQHIDRWAVGHTELAPGVVGDTHLHPTAVERVREVAAGSGVGQLLVVSATGASFASGGAYVTADSIVYQHGFDGVTAPGDSTIWPVDAVGEIQVEFAWGTYEGGGTIEIEVDGVVPAWGLVASGAEGQEGCKRRSVHIPQGSLVKVKVTQSSGVAQTANVIVEFSIPDPSQSVAPPGLVETLWLDSRVDTLTTPVSGIHVLLAGANYRVDVVGNFRIASTATYGSPDTIMFPSPGQSADANAGFDAETKYAHSLAGSYPAHQTIVEMNVGSGWAHLEPVGGPFSAPQAEHRYSLAVVGEGSVLQVRLSDSPYTDNNGQLLVEVYGP